jgi:hypothetical protein
VIGGTAEHQGDMWVQVITLCRLTGGRVTVHAARVGDNSGSFGEQRHGTSLPVVYLRKRRNRF